MISRTISTQRKQIAALKAFGYSNTAIGVHYVKLVMLIVLIGVAGGLAAGIRLGDGLAGIYMEFYRFPFLLYELRPSVALTAALITMASALAGTVYSVRKAAMLPPAEAMRPEPPARYRRTILEYLGLGPLLSQPTRIVFRNIERRPMKSLLTVTGISLACAIMIAGTFSRDAVDFMVDVQFRLSQREDMTVTFTDPISRRALYELKGLRGVEHAEVFRSVPVPMKFEHRSYRTSIRGIEPGGHLHHLLDTGLLPVELPPDGIVLTDYLGTVLGVRHLDVFRQDSRRTLSVICYLNTDWRAEEGGQLRQYLGETGVDNTRHVDILPEGGTLACFLSSRFAHEVLPATRNRLSLTGWYRRRG